MRKSLISVVLLMAAAAIAVGAAALWRHRAWRPAVTVNGAVLTCGEMRARAEGLLDDAERHGGLIVPAGKREEALRAFAVRAAKLWLFKRLMLDEAVRRGLFVTPEEAAESLKSMEKRLSERGMTLEDYFRRGPLPEEVLREEFREAVLVNKLIDAEVRGKIKLGSDELSMQLAKMQREEMERARAASEKSGEAPATRRVSRKEAMVALSAHHYREGLKAFYRPLLAAADVQSTVFSPAELKTPSELPEN